jgi:hypothetical protein
MASKHFQVLATAFAVKNKLTGCTLSFVSTPLSPKGKSRRSPKGTAAVRKAFWARSANPELDRSGDWPLKNLSSTRAKSASRF